MRCPVVIGRDVEVDSLLGLIDAARRGSGEATVLVGEAGIGKSRLARHALEVARRAGLTTLVGRADQLSADTPMVPVAEAFLAATRRLTAPTDDDLRAYVPLLASFLPHWRAAGWSTPLESTVVLAEGVLRLLEHLAGGGGLLLVLEDLHWADPATLAVTGYLAEHVSETNISMIATVRGGERGSEAVAKLERRGARVLPLQRLADADVESMIAACLDAQPEPDTLAAVVRDAKGLPLLVEDLLIADGGSRPPRRFADTVRERLRQLEPSEMEVLAVTGILGPLATIGLIAAVARRNVAAVSAALDHAVALQLLSAEPSEIAFRHALTRDVITGDLAPAEASALRRTAARAVRASALDPVSRALASASLLADAGDRLESSRAHVAAGKEALAAGEVDRAIAALQRAVRDAQDDDTEIEAALALAEALLERGDAAGADDVARPLGGRTAGRDPTAARSVWLLVARAATAAGRWDDAVIALGAIKSSDDSALIPDIAVLEARIALGVGRGGTRVDAEHLAHRAAALASEVGRVDLQCEAFEIAGLAARTQDLDRAAGLLEQALELAGLAQGDRRRLQVLNELATVEMLRDARPDRLELAIAESRRVGAIGTAIGAELNLSSLLVMTGRFQDASALASSVAGTAQRLGLGPIEAAAHLMLGFAAAHQASRGEAEAELKTAESLARDDPDLRAGAWAIGRGLLALLEEDRAAARRAFQRARHESPDVYARILNPYEGPDLLVRAVEGDADLADVDVAAERAVRGARWSDLWMGCARAVIHGASGEPDQAAAAAAVALGRGEPYPVFHAIAARLVGEAALRDGWGKPVMLLEPAEALFDAVGASRAAATCRGLLKRAGRQAPRRRAVDRHVADALRIAGVTAREAEVLDLLADRLTNRELAERLYLSPRTVEKHVASLLLKLDVADRAGLADIARSLPH